MSEAIPPATPATPSDPASDQAPDSAQLSGTSKLPRGKAGRERLDVLVVRRGLAPSRERARALIMAREVLVDGRVVDKAGAMVPSDAACTLATPPAELRYVSRGGLKLERALDAFALDPAGCVCLDVGASTGGFTDVLLRRGAARVYAVDVGHGQLAWSLRQDPRVVAMERVNIRHLESLPEPIDACVIDVSFISLRLVLPAVARLLRPGAWVVALVKPQFEAGRAEATRGGGVITDAAVHRRVLADVLTWLSAPRQAEGAGETRLVARGLTGSPIAGRDGNHEYLLWLAAVPAAAMPGAEVSGADAPEVVVGANEIDHVVAATLNAPALGEG